MIGDQHAIWEENYRRRTNFGARPPNALCLALTERLSPNAKVLEIGCSLGNDAAFIASQGHHVLATDISETAIDTAREHRGGLENLTFAQHDAALPFDLPAASLDGVYARLSLHYHLDATLRLVFAELARLLRPGGLLVFMCKSPDDPLYGRGTPIEPDVFEHDHLRHFFSEAYARELLARDFAVESLVAKNEQLYNEPSAWIEVIARRRPHPLAPSPW